MGRIVDRRRDNNGLGKEPIITYPFLSPSVVVTGHQRHNNGLRIQRMINHPFRSPSVVVPYPLRVSKAKLASYGLRLMWRQAAILANLEELIS